MWLVSAGQLTHEWQVTEGGRNMEPHAVIAESPIVSWSGIALSHDTFDAERLQSCSQSSSTVQVSQLHTRHGQRAFYENSRISTSNNEDLSLEVEVIESSRWGLKQPCVLGMQIQAVEPCAQNPYFPLDCLGPINSTPNRQEQNLSFAGSGR